MSRATLLSGANHTHLQKAHQYLIDIGIHDEEIIAVWCISPENIRATSLAPFAPALAMPCFWPQLCCLSPCIIAGYSATKEVCDGTIYVLGRKNLYRIVDAKVGGGSSPCPCFGFTTGRDSAMQELSGIQGIVAVNSCGEGCCVQLRISHVSIGVPFGSPLANSGATKHQALNTHFVMLVEEPEKAARVIREAKEQFNQPTEAVVAVPVNAMVMERPSSAGVQNIGNDEDDHVKKIRNLKTLLDEELITVEEYETKKAEILERI
mmetsp:Transcript_3741/g.5752  ORF Transcript_3741/g.5752 Transcript_3741/m.5752 type:complete len:264 (+) Transcript_3741:65-856(+)